jgi:serine/threonine protein kinase
MQSPKKKKIGKYEIERQIGKGSAATIYLAKQDLLGRRLIVKELLPQYASNEKIITRFQREARGVSRLTHDTIVHVYDYWTRGQSYYIAMEYVSGKNLRDILATVHFLPVHIAAMIVYHICRGLGYAHENGVVHRDLKPPNIMISEIGQVKILDFGIAHFKHDDNITSLGAVIGTYNYMSPEQALGKKVTPASDIFSLGVLFYELLTGFKPFIKDDRGEVLEKIVHQGFRSPRKLNPAVPRSFEKIIKRCLKKKERRRFQNTRIIQKRLEKYLRNFSLDHQAVLKDYLQNLTPRILDKNWPPGYWRRIGYRLTHQKIRTYFYWLVGVCSVLSLEYRLNQKEITPKKQWEAIQNFGSGLVQRFVSEKKVPIFSLPQNFLLKKDTAEVQATPDSVSTDASILEKEPGESIQASD